MMDAEDLVLSGMFRQLQACLGRSGQGVVGDL